MLVVMFAVPSGYPGCGDRLRQTQQLMPPSQQPLLKAACGGGGDEAAGPGRPPVLTAPPSSNRFVAAKQHQIRLARSPGEAVSQQGPALRC